MTADDYCMVYVTVNEEEHARIIVKDLLEKRLIACANVIPLRSFYKWEGKDMEEDELVMLMKTKRSLFKKVEKEVRGLHPYKVPCIVCYPMVNGYDEYLAWIDGATRK